MSSGDIDEPISLVEYDAGWPASFAAEADRLCPHVVPPVTAIHHVGSTAVVGLAGKPIVDLLLGVPALDVGAAVAARLETLGYENFGRVFVDERYYLRRRGAGSFNVAVAATDSRFFELQLAVRDYLRAHPGAAAEYAAAKRAALASGATRFSTYSQHKQATVAALMQRASAWQTSRGDR